MQVKGRTRLRVILYAGCAADGRPTLYEDAGHQVPIMESGRWAEVHKALNVRVGSMLRVTVEPLLLSESTTEEITG